MTTHPVTLLHTTVRRSAADVYAYASDARNITHWASGLSGSALRPDGEGWLADSPMGRVRIVFAPRNAFGVVDHDVTLPDGKTVHNPLRVQPNGDGADVIFTLHRLPGVSDAAFQADQDHIRKDLATLKGILER